MRHGANDKVEVCALSNNLYALYIGTIFMKVKPLRKSMRICVYLHFEIFSKYTINYP